MSNYDYELTKEAVNEVMENYIELVYKLDSSMIITQSYEINYSSPNFNISKLENFVVKKIMLEEEKKEFLQLIRNSFNKQSLRNKIILNNIFFEDDKKNDFDMAEKLKCSTVSFYNYKKKAIFNFAVALGIEQYVEVEDV